MYMYTVYMCIYMYIHTHILFISLFISYLIFCLAWACPRLGLGTASWVGATTGFFGPAGALLYLHTKTTTYTNHDTSYYAYANVYIYKYK